MPRALVLDDGRIRRYRVTNGGGQVVGFDEETVPTTEDVNAATLRSLATQALAANAAYLAVGSPSAAQVAAQVRLLTRETTALIRLLLGVLDSTDGT